MSGKEISDELCPVPLEETSEDLPTTYTFAWYNQPIDDDDEMTGQSQDVGSAGRNRRKR